MSHPNNKLYPAGAGFKEEIRCAHVDLLAEYFRSWLADNPDYRLKDPHLVYFNFSTFFIVLDDDEPCDEKLKCYSDPIASREDDAEAKRMRLMA